MVTLVKDKALNSNLDNMKLGLYKILEISGILAVLAGGSLCLAATFEIHPATVDSNEEFENIANSLKPGDECVIPPGTKHSGRYSKGYRAIDAFSAKRVTRI